MTPPERLRQELVLQRERGRPFRAAWPVALNVALRDEALMSAIWWRQVLDGEQRAVWAASYGGPNRRRTMFAPDADEGVAGPGPLIAA